MAIVCISRQFGAGGKTLAERVAGRLGYFFADKELTTRVAREAGVSDEWVKITEREGSRGGKLFASGLFSSGFIERLLVDSDTKTHETQLVELFRKIIPEMAARGDTVFVGRGSQFILADHPGVIKILLVAPHEYRVNFMISHHHLNKDEAETTVKEWDVNRASFLKKLTDLNPNEPSLYDLTLNTSVIRLEWAESLICNLVGKRESGAGT